MEKVNPGNYTRTMERIEKIADGLEKLYVSLLCGFSLEYVKLKLEECTLVYQFKLKKAEEQEEQRIIKEQMREEERARKEFEKAIRESEKEEKMYATLLERAKKELESVDDALKTELQMKIDLLQEQLQEAHEKGQRAQSMAEQTKKGHVYIISNIGSFGEDVYKVGLTRRLEPVDRVKELSGASVPFKFDVHALIYSDDAPALESELHRKLTSKRVNAVNKRKEFFNVPLDEIKTVAESVTGNNVEFKMTAVAEEYFETLRLLGSNRSS